MFYNYLATIRVETKRKKRMTLPVLFSSFKSSLFVLLLTATFLVWHVCHAQQQKLDPLYRMNTIAGGGFDDDVDARQVSIGPSKVYYKRNTGIIYISGEFLLVLEIIYIFWKM